MPGKIILETERLLLREFDEADAPAFLPLVSDPAVTKYTGDGGMTNLEQAVQGIRERLIGDYRRHGFGRWACVHKDDGAVIGFSGLKFLDELDEVELGYRYLPAYWGQGLATEAGRACIQYGFNRLGFRRIIGLVVPENAGSIRVLQKLGFSLEESILYRGDTVVKYALAHDVAATR